MIRNHKKLAISVVAIIVLLVTAIIGYKVDLKRILENKEPIFAIKGYMVKDGGTVEYKGLGYKIIYWNRLAMEYRSGVMVTGRYIGYEMSSFPNLKSVSDEPGGDIKFVPIRVIPRERYCD